MFLLAAIVPDRFGVIDHDSVGWHHGIVRFDGHEAGKKAHGGRHVILDGLTRLVESGLNDTVVLYGNDSQSNCRQQSKRLVEGCTLG